MSYMKSFFGHLRNIIVHKYWVFHYCRIFGITWRGIVHDLSKFHPTEFFESVRYYQGTSSPIPVCKKANKISYGWQHHKGRNPHHYEYWVDNLDNGTPTYHNIPYEYLMEMLADWFAAGRTYKGKDFKVMDEVEWWREKRENPNLAMAQPVKSFINLFMNDCEFFYGVDWVKDKHNRQVLRNRLSELYLCDKYLR